MMRAAPVLHALTPTLLLSATALAAPVLDSAQGSVELQQAGGTWMPRAASGEITLGLRTGAGRAEIRDGAGRVTVGSASRLRRYLDEVDLQQGRFYLRGPAAVHVQGQHLVMDGAGSLRVDLDGPVRRVAVITGQVRIDRSGRVTTVRGGQQLDLRSGQLSAFRETDPWYAAQFRGEGSASVQATRGAVTLGRAGQARGAVIGDTLEIGATLNTGAGAWAEVGFTGGGYLRLNEQSELSVLSVDRTDRGREVLLKLARGTAWNVVQKGQGGYRIDTPVMSTAVRGTVFRVDADGLVKVFEGQVALPSSADQAVSAGQQRSGAGTVGTLVPDATDRFNQARDAERARPLSLTLPRAPLSLSDLILSARSLPDATLSAQVAGQRVPLNADGDTFRLERLAAPLPEGTYPVTVTAERFGQTLTRTVTVTVDRSAPQVALRAEQRGHLLLLSGAVTDAVPGTLTVTVRIGPRSYTRRVTSGEPLRWALPLADPTAPVQVSARDAAGNERDAALR